MQLDAGEDPCSDGDTFHSSPSQNNRANESQRRDIVTTQEAEMFMGTYDGMATEKGDIVEDVMSGLDDDDTLNPTGSLHIHESFADRIIEDYSVVERSYHRVTTYHSQQIRPSTPPLERIGRIHESQGDPFNFEVPLESLEKYIWEFLSQRTSQFMDPRDCNGSVHPIFGFDHENPPDSDLCWKLNHDSMHLSTEELGRFMELRPVSVNTPAQEGAAFVYYFREFEFEAPEFSRLLDLFGNCNFADPKIETWKQVRDRPMNNEANVFVRYVGMTTSRKTGWNRLDEDHHNQRKYGIYSKFLELLKSHMPSILNDVKVFEFPRATYSSTLPPDRRSGKRPLTLVDDRERILIALLNKEVLLNQQAGGFYPIYVPMQKELAPYENINLKARLALLTEDDTTQIHQKIGEWAHAMFESLTPYSSVTADVTPYLNAMKSQASGSAIRSRYLLLLVGKDVTETDFIQGSTYFGGFSRAAWMTLRLLESLDTAEGRQSPKTLETLLSKWYPFVDLYPVPGVNDTELCMPWLCQYLHITRPRIIVTHSRRVFVALRARFGRPLLDNEMHVPSRQ